MPSFSFQAIQKKVENSIGRIQPGTKPGATPVTYDDPELRFVLRVNDTQGDPAKAPLEISGGIPHL